MKRIIFLMALVLMNSAIFAQKKTKKSVQERQITLVGRVVNSFTKAGVEAKVTLMTSDSVFVDSVNCWLYGNDTQYLFTVTAKPAKYIIKAEHPEYHTTFVNYEVNYVARNRSFDLPTHLMKRKNPTRDLNQMLDQIDVVASKVKFLHKGDTLVFNADAFNVPEGSMLDELIRQLPGVELKNDGEIYVNGRKVDELLLNGDRFFNGDRQLMLENLPYYVVKNIKVYDRLSAQDKWIGKQTEKKEYVMDVNMKKEFFGTYLGNIDVGAGTNDRWLGRLFAMRFTNHSQLAVLGNMNNVNVSSQPGQNTEWNPNEYTQNERTMKNIGINWTTHDKDKKFDEDLNATIQWQNDDNQQHVAFEQFASSGNIYNKSMQTNKSNMFKIDFNNRFNTDALFGSKSFYIDHRLHFNYTKGDANSSMRSASLSKDPSKYNLDVPQMLDSIFSALKDSEFYEIATNRMTKLSKNESNSFQMSSNLNFNTKMPWGDLLFVSLNGSYDKQTINKSFSRNKTEFLQDGTTDFRNEYQPSPSKNYNYTATVAYRFDFLSGWSISPGMSFNQRYSDTANEYYRLDRLGKGWDADSDESILGQLPSTRDSMQIALDRQNSVWHDNLNREYKAALGVVKSRSVDLTNTFFRAEIGVTKYVEWMRYDNIDLSQTNLPSARLERSNTLPTGILDYSYEWGSISGKPGGGRVEIDYNFSMSRPSFTQLYNITLTNNPLITRYSNPDLKNLRNHVISASFSKWNNKCSYGVRPYVSIVQNNWGTHTLYNPDKGSYIYKPDNVNGNWSANFYGNFSSRLDSANHWNIYVNPSVKYNHNVDFDIEETSPEWKEWGEAPLSKVNTLILTNSLGGEYTYGELRLAVSGVFNWRNSTSKRANFQTINAFEFNYGLNGQYTIQPLGLMISTSLTMFSRRGYQDNQMNTDDLIWNIGIFQSFLKGKPLTLKIEGIDLLHQLSSKDMSVNAQGRSETWTNSIPNYLMLHAIYKFNITPKKKL